jgi:hypothetical protein
MNTRWKQFEALAARAREETGPRLDVTARVLRDLRHAPAVPRSNLPLWVISGASLAAASIILVLSVQCWQSWTDPWSGLFDALTLVMQ